jgi:WD40 repeat protein
VLGDNRGSVAVIAPGGDVKYVSTGWDGSVEGLAWSPSGDEIWFSAAEAGTSRALHAVTLSGELRTILRTAGGVTLQDVFGDGRVLISRDIERGEILGLGPGETGERDLSWLDGSVAVDISDNGRTLLFMEQGAAAGPTYTVCLRDTDGSPVVRLGEGAAAGLSPDGAWALAILYGSPEQLVLLPVGAGENRTLPRHQIVRYHSARWFPDGQRLLVVGSEVGQGPRCYEQPIDGGVPRALTGEGVGIRGLPISPDGKTLVVTGPGRTPFLQSIEGGETRPVPGLEAREVVIRWGADGKTLFVHGASEIPTRVYRLDVESGKKELWKELVPSDRAGVQGIGQVRLTPDAGAYAYSFKRLLCDLYLVEGLA